MYRNNTECGDRAHVVDTNNIFLEVSTDCNDIELYYNEQKGWQNEHAVASMQPHQIVFATQRSPCISVQQKQSQSNWLQ